MFCFFSRFICESKTGMNFSVFNLLSVRLFIPADSDRYENEIKVFVRSSSFEQLTVKNGCQLEKESILYFD